MASKRYSQDLSLAEVEAVSLTPAQYRAWELEWKSDTRAVGREVNWFAHQVGFKSRLLRTERSAQPQMKPVLPLEDRIKHTRDGGLETLSYAFRRPGKRRIHGIASTPMIDSHNSSLSSAGCMVRFPIPLLSSHSKFGKAIGDVTLVRRCERQIFIQANIHENAAGDYAWGLIQDGELACLSVGPADSRLQAEVDGVKFYDQWRLKEVSICRKGANPDCIFEVLNGDAISGFSPTHGLVASPPVTTLEGRDGPEKERGHQPLRWKELTE